ncbi:hypothetical protein L316_00917 [Escherichia coli SHECO002]|nr:hypothetical protein L317_01210 [Escherichia coli SHECO003]OSM93547.1 hypothetical protein L316_00917 [Escherichia coli SHECO002]
MTNANLPDALRLSGLRYLCNPLILHNFVGWIRRSRRIRHEQRARCQQSEQVLLHIIRQRISHNIVTHLRTK